MHPSHDLSQAYQCLGPVAILTAPRQRPRGLSSDMRDTERGWLAGRPAGTANTGSQCNTVHMVLCLFYAFHEMEQSRVHQFDMAIGLITKPQLTLYSLKQLVATAHLPPTNPNPAVRNSKCPSVLMNFNCSGWNSGFHSPEYTTTLSSKTYQHQHTAAYNNKSSANSYPSYSHI